MASEKAFALVYSDPVFDRVLDYYKMFPQETSSITDKSGVQSNLAITLPSSQGRVATFEALVDAMTTHAAAADKNFVVVTHGLHDAKNVPIALGLNLTTATTVKANDFFFKTMEEWRQKTLTTAQAATEEGKVFFKGDKGQHITLPAGILSGLHTKLTALRALKLHRVELRACALGANVPFLKDVRTVLGADAMTAPDQHMFFSDRLNLTRPALVHGRAVTLTDPMTDAEFAGWLKRHPGARGFTDAATGEQFGFEDRGSGPARTVFAATTSGSLRWFVGAAKRVSNCSSAGTVASGRGYKPSQNVTTSPRANLKPSRKPANPCSRTRASIRYVVSSRSLLFSPNTFTACCTTGRQSGGASLLGSSARSSCRSVSRAALRASLTL